ncbi:hypothetical protein EOA28_25935 [Mesorhizobium sp. M2A.F.Ca.ET.067.02.1.1]|nr:hypothetical protein EOA28_25935 [Mesorhizobium sp. M2A.F.Ca.ET.067.02.1.1]TIU55181.1 MAG: hypothetical protein E5W35_19255 [Mesorhizobium sp.]
MGQVLHGSATTTEAVRRAIEHEHIKLVIGNDWNLRRRHSYTAGWRYGVCHGRCSKPCSD